MKTPVKIIPPALTTKATKTPLDGLNVFCAPNPWRILLTSYPLSKGPISYPPGIQIYIIRDYTLTSVLLSTKKRKRHYKRVVIPLNFLPFEPHSNPKHKALKTR